MYACTMDGRTCWTNAQRGRYRKAVGGRNGKEPQVCFPGIEWALFAQKGRSRVQRSFQETYIPQPINPFYHNPCPIVRTFNRKGWKFLGGDPMNNEKSPQPDCQGQAGAEIKRLKRSVSILSICCFVQALTLWSIFWKIEKIIGCIEAIARALSILVDFHF